jgi:hypothetical protein
MDPMPRQRTCWVMATLINSKQTVADVLTTQKGLLLTMGLLHLSMLPFNMISKFHHTFA